MDKIFKLIFFAFIPISELRGAIPYGYFVGVSIYLVVPLAIIMNILASLFAFLFLDTLHSLFLKIRLYNKIFNHFSERALKKVGDKFEKYEYWGLMLFVAIPLPITGAWTGTLGAWLLELDRKKAILFICFGVLISATIVTIVVLTGSEVFSIFIKSRFK